MRFQKGLKHNYKKLVFLNNFKEQIASMSASWEQTINSESIKLFQDCEVVVGSIIFLKHVFDDDIPGKSQKLYLCIKKYEILFRGA